MTEQSQVGFSQRIQLDWLERTASLVLAGSSSDEIRAALHELLKDKLSTSSPNTRQSNRTKAISNLMRIWVDVPPAAVLLRNEALVHFQRLPAKEHLAIHWGMAMVAYPFFGTVAETIGRLLRLQGRVVAAQILRRLSEQLGERETVMRAAQRIVRCFIDWGVLCETGEQGVYEASYVQRLIDRELTAWLIEATLIASEAQSGAFTMISQSPTLFPFTLAPLKMYDLEQNGRLELFRQGLDEDIVALRSALHPTAAASPRKQLSLFD